MHRRHRDSGCGARGLRGPGARAGQAAGVRRRSERGRSRALGHQRSAERRRASQGRRQAGRSARGRNRLARGQDAAAHRRQLLAVRDHPVRLRAAGDADHQSAFAQRRRSLRSERLCALPQRHRRRGRGHERADAAAGEDAQPRWLRERLAAAGAGLRNQGGRMWKLSLGTILLTAFGALTHAQTQQELLRDSNGGSTDNVLTYGMGYHQQRYSPLKQISKSTVKRLVPVWSASLANEFGEQGQPLVYNGVLYTANVKRVVAIDVATGRQLWTTPLEWDAAVARVVCCGLSNRGVALYDGKVFVGSVDAHLRALDAKTGKEVWKVKIAEWKEGYSITSAPTVANGVLMTGMTGGEYGVRGFVDGYDPDTGKHLWRRHTTAGPGEKGSETWPAGDAYLRGGGSTWITGSYDPGGPAPAQVGIARRP